MTRIIFSLSLVFMLSTLSFGQKVKFKNLRCNAQKCNLPTQKVAPENRNYSVEVKGLYSSQVDAEAGRLYGWNKVESNPTVHGVISVYGFQYGRPKLNSAKKEKKDKEGNVTEKWTEYHYSVTSKGKSTLYVYGPSNPFKYQMSDRQKKKAKEAEEAAKAKEAAAAKAVADNPFLKDVDVEPAGDDEEGADEGASDIQLELLKQINMDQEETFKTAKKRSAKEVLELFRNNVKDQQYEFKQNYPQRAFRSGMNSLNNEYGFRPVKNFFSLQEIKKGDIREVDDWNNAVTAAKTIMASLRYNTDLNQTRTDMQPIIDFFYGIMSSYPADDKKKRKIGAAAFENILALQNYLDLHDENITLGNKYIDDKKLDRMSKKAIKKAERFKAHLAFLEMPFRHLTSGADVEDGNIEEEEDNVADEGN